MEELMVRPQAEIVTREKIQEYMSAFGLASSLSKQEANQFVEIAAAFNLNPFKREIYCIPYGTGDKRRLSIITGYVTYLKRADRIGMLRGWKAWTEGSFTIESKKVQLDGRNGPYTKEKRLPVGDLVAKVVIHRQGWDQPFEHEVYLDEYAQDNDMWASKPRTMLKKVCIAQAFRLCFPDEMGGMPYTSDELSPSMTEPRDVTPEIQVKDEPPVKAEPPKEAPRDWAKDRKFLLSRLKEIIETKDSGQEVFVEDEITTAREQVKGLRAVGPDVEQLEKIVEEYQSELSRRVTKEMFSDVEVATKIEIPEDIF